MRFLLSWLFYEAGNLVSRFEDRGFEFYSLYKWLMILSIKVEGDSHGPWRYWVENELNKGANP